MAIDTLDYAQKLEAAGVDRKQAEAHAKALSSAILGSVATKADIEALGRGTKADIDALRVATKADLSALELRLTKYMIGQSIATAGLILAAGGLLLRFLR